MIYNDFETIANTVVCREQTAEFFQSSLRGAGIDVRFAPSKTIEPRGRTAQELSECPDVNRVLDSLRFPLIVKPRISAILSHCHDMVIVSSKEYFFVVLSLPMYCFLLEDTILIQEYFENHYETLLKLYVVGDRSAVAKRPSIPKKWVDKELLQKGYVAVNREMQPDEPFQHKPEKLVISEESEEMLRQLTRLINSKLGLHIIGLDLCCNQSDRKFYIFDCNFFSSYEDAFYEYNLGDLILDAMKPEYQKLK